jgi:uracil-DNA glycosylase family 4
MSATSPLFTKEIDYESLCKAASECRDCERVFHPLTYLNENNGNINSPVIFIGEAPGFVRDPNHRLKAFHGNQSGHNFEHLLRTVGLERDQVFVTNALLHTPVSPSQKKYDDTYGYLQIRPPSFNEIRECGKFLRRQLDIVDPKIICTLGRTALNACQFVLPGFPSLSLFHDAAKPIGWNGKIIYPLYHTSPNVTSSIRNLRQMEKDFQGLKKLIDDLSSSN